ncbi:adenosylcobinamide-GDP ribazoletransferase [Fusobacterium sp. PH5-44]|uniref:adenosylcobinamide-GDP ribazoletransferase n=1 Tax=unclassified Fusobacterium TaxID=2648384 RepID=UPI003D241E88
MINGLLLLLKSTTKIPTIISPKEDDKQLGQSMKFFPVVGIIIGIILYFLYELLNGVIVSKFSMAASLIAIELILTGAIHFEGLASVFNAIFKYRSKQKMLEMLKESNLGTTGVLVLIITIVLKTVFIAEARTGIGATFLILPVIGRLNCLVNSATNSAARSTGKGKLFADNTKISDLIIGLIITMVYFICLLLLTNYFDWIVVVVSLIFLIFILLLGYIFGKWMNKRIGGITGDTLGAVIELTEVVTAIGIYIVSSSAFERICSIFLGF